MAIKASQLTEILQENTSVPRPSSGVRPIRPSSSKAPRMHRDISEYEFDQDLGILEDYEPEDHLENSIDIAYQQHVNERRSRENIEVKEIGRDRSLSSISSQSLSSNRPKYSATRPKSSKREQSLKVGSQGSDITLDNSSVTSSEGPSILSDQQLYGYLSDLLDQRLRTKQKDRKISKPPKGSTVEGLPSDLAIKEAIHHLWDITDTRNDSSVSRPSTATSNRRPSSARPTSATSQMTDRTAEKSTIHMTTKPLYNRAARMQLHETTLIEARIYEDNLRNKIRLANEFCVGLHLQLRWELLVLEGQKDLYRVALSNEYRMLKEMSVGRFLHEYEKLRQTRIQAHKDRRSGRVSDISKAAKERSQEKSEQEQKSANKILFTDTSRLIVALEEQVNLLRWICDH